MSRTKTVEQIDASGAGADTMTIEHEREDLMDFYHRGEENPVQLPTVHMQQWLAEGMQLQPFDVVDRAFILCDVDPCTKRIKLASEKDPESPAQLERALSMARILHVFHRHPVQAMWILTEQEYDRCRALSSRRIG